MWEGKSYRALHDEKVRKDSAFSCMQVVVKYSAKAW